MADKYRGKNGSIELNGKQVRWDVDRQKAAIDLRDHQVEVVVDSLGAIDKRVTATRLMLTGPFAFGLRKKKDKRELCLLVTSDSGESAMLECDPKKANDARRFAAKLSSTAKAAYQPPAAEATAPSPAIPSAPDPADQLRKLGELRESGLITPEEFEAKKTELLERM